MLYLIALVVLWPSFVFGFNDTSDYYKCYNRTGGSWAYGRAPSICDVTPFLDEGFIKREFADYVFEDLKGIDSERLSYMTELHAMIREMAIWYLKERKPAVGNVEMNNWIEAVFAMANQESYWSHYRISSSKRLQMMRGDYGHGHGLFQVDDRWHFNAVTDGRAANIVMNGIYSLEEYYAAWARSATAWCIDSETDYYNRSRAAYSAYNGGPSKICRWTNPNDKWARNDKGYKQKLDGKGWRKYITDFSLPSKIDIGCVVDGSENCTAAATTDELIDGILYLLEDGRVCALDNGALGCVDSIDSGACLAGHLRNKFGSSAPVRKASPELLDGIQISNWPKQSICSLGVNGLFSIGDIISSKKNINLRSTPGGKLLKTTKAGEVFQVMGYAVTEYPELKRYYFIKSGAQFGYLYAGKESDYRSWTVISDKEPEEKFIAKRGDLLKVVALEGIPFFEDGIRSGDRIPEGEVLEVNYFVVTSIDTLYYSVKYGDQSILIYAGNVGDIQNLSKDIVIYDEDNIPVWGQLIDSIYYMNVRSCKSTSCKINGVISGPKIKEEKFIIHEDDGTWLKISSGSIEGFIKKKYAVIEE